MRISSPVRLAACTSDEDREEPILDTAYIAPNCPLVSIGLFNDKNTTTYTQRRIGGIAGICGRGAIIPDDYTLPENRD